MSIDLCDCTQSFKQQFLFIYIFIVHMFHPFWFQKWPSWTINMSIPLVQGNSFVPRYFVRSGGRKFNLKITTSTSKHELYICLYWLHCVNIMRQYSIPRIFFSILIQNIWFQCSSYYLWHHTQPYYPLSDEWNQRRETDTVMKVSLQCMLVNIQYRQYLIFWSTVYIVSLEEYVHYVFHVPHLNAWK